MHNQKQLQSAMKRRLLLLLDKLSSVESQIQDGFVTNIVLHNDAEKQLKPKRIATLLFKCMINIVHIKDNTMESFSLLSYTRCLKIELL